MTATLHVVPEGPALSPEHQQRFAAYHAYSYPLARGWGFSRVRDGDLAEDLYQSAVLKLCERWQRDPAAFPINRGAYHGTIIRMMAHHIANDRRKAHAVGKGTTKKGALPPTTQLSDAHEELTRAIAATVAAPPVAEAEDDACDPPKMLWAILVGSLRVRPMQVILEWFSRDLDRERTATALGMTLGAVDRTIARARPMLQRELQWLERDAAQTDNPWYGTILWLQRMDRRWKGNIDCKRRLAGQAAAWQAEKAQRREERRGRQDFVAAKAAAMAAAVDRRLALADACSIETETQPQAA